MEFDMPTIKFIKADSEDIIQTSGLFDGGSEGTTDDPTNSGDGSFWG